MNNKNLAVVLFAAVMTITIGMQPVYAQTATGTATVEPKTCGLDLTAGTTVNYGILIAGSLSVNPAFLLPVTNTGNSDGDVSLIGQDWTEQANQTNTVMLVNQTHWSANAPIDNQGSYDTAVDLSKTVNTIFGPSPPNTPSP